MPKETRKEFYLLTKRRKNQLIREELASEVAQHEQIDKDLVGKEVLSVVGTSTPSINYNCPTPNSLKTNCINNEAMGDFLGHETNEQLFIDRNTNANLLSFSTHDNVTPFPENAETSESNYAKYLNTTLLSQQTLLGDELLKKELVELVVEYNVSHSVVNKLLQILRRHGHSLPSDVRALLKTPKATTTNYVSTISGGQYAHLQFSVGVSRSIKRYFSIIPTTVKVNINIDGLPLCKSSTMQFWPILGAIIADFYTEPFLIGVFYGKKKPEDANEYLKPFVEEYLSIMENGLFIDGVKVNITLNAIICDAPAKAFICGIKSHTGYFGCSKCIQEGDFVQNRVVFPEVDSSLRTDTAFKNKLQPEHHIRESCLEKLNIGMVSQVPLDYMHLVCLGVTKRLLQFWIKGRLNVRLKDIDQISEIFVNMKCSITEEFARLPRSLLEVDHWKATEFRQFLLYTGPVLLHKKLPPVYYEHFLSLSVAVRILIDSKLSSKFIDYAQSLLIWFVKCYGELYGHEFLSYNVHNLIHLPGDVKAFGPLDKFSAFKYENYMQKIKHKLRNSGNYLQQLVNRLSEESYLDLSYKVPQKYPTLKFCKTNQEIIQSIKFDGFSISNKNCVMLDDGVIGMVDSISICDKKCVVQIRKFHDVEPFFRVPCDSRQIGIGVLNITIYEEMFITVEAIKRKCVMLNYWNDKYVILPLLHSEN